MTPERVGQDGAAMRGYNGELLLTDDEVRIGRGLKSLLVRKKWPVQRSIPCVHVREVWFQPSSGRLGWPGYVLVVDETSTPSDAFVARVRDDRAVTFLGRADEWRSFAAAIAKRCEASFREFRRKVGRLATLRAGSETSGSETAGVGCAWARPYGVPGASLVSWRGLPSGVARR